MRKTALFTAIFIVVLISIVTILTVVPSTATSAEQSNTTIESSKEVEDLQQLIYSKGYNYTVAPNRITQLSPEGQDALCGYIPITSEEKPSSENIRFFSDVSKVEAKKQVTGGLGQLPPSSYNSMALGYVTPVRTQGPCGSCWIFGVIADLESDIAIVESNFLDLSEQDVGDCNIWSSAGGYGFCNGGNAYMAINYLTKFGSVNESCHPYRARSEYCYNCPPQKNVDNWRMITGSNGESENQKDAIKNAILNYGPVYSTIYASDPGFHAYSGGIYEYDGAGTVNHAVQIIGWNDTLGAWLIKNSWGTDWGAFGPYRGCAWVAYGSANLGDYTSAIARYKNPPDKIFYHDECGWMGSCLGYNNPVAYGAVRFSPTQNSTLTAVDFWAVDASMTYEIEILDTLNDSGGGRYGFSNQLGTTQLGTTDEPGYYSIPLDTKVELTSGDDFIIQVKFTTDGYRYPIPIDYIGVSWLNWADVATFSGESYYSSDGFQFEKPSPYDVGIRARTQISQIHNLSISLNQNRTILLSWDGDINPAGSYDIYITEDYRTGFPINPNYTITGLSWTDPNAESYMERYYDISLNGSQRIGNPVGKFDLLLTKKAGGTGKNLISIPFETDINKASELMNDIGIAGSSGPPKGNCTTVNRWNSTSQRAEGWLSANGGVGKNFDIVPGEGYEVWVNADTSWTVVGKVPEISMIELRKKAGGTGKNWISLPLFCPIANASELINSIGKPESKGNCTVVNKWNSTSQRAEGWLHGGFGKNFYIIPGQGYEAWVYKNTSWIPPS